jgi:hypothetical protein
MTKKGKKWDAFICYASEDKIVVRALAEELRALELRVWFDEFTLELGDSIRRSIDYGLASSRFGIVILSHSFFTKKWPQRELDGLVVRATDSREKRILPLWHEINRKDIAKYSPTLADLVSVSTAEEIRNVSVKLAKVIELQSRDGDVLSKTDLTILISSWEPLKEDWLVSNFWPTEWRDFKRKSKKVNRILENSLIKIGYNPTCIGPSSEDTTRIMYRDIPLHYFIELKETINTILEQYTNNIVWLEDKQKGWNLLVLLGKDIGE